MNYYRAPWSRSLIVVSSLLTILCVGIAVAAVNKGGWVVLGGVGMVTVALGCALFVVRGYTLEGDVLLVHRPLWTTRLGLEGLESVETNPQAMRRSLRTFGNGGFYSFTGYYWNKTLGNYRAFVTDPSRAVVLRWPDRTVVVSPDSPSDFASRVRQMYFQG